VTQCCDIISSIIIAALATNRSEIWDGTVLKQMTNAENGFSGRVDRNLHFLLAEYNDTTAKEHSTGGCDGHRARLLTDAVDERIWGTD